MKLFNLSITSVCILALISCGGGGGGSSDSQTSHEPGYIAPEYIAPDYPSYDPAAIENARVYLSNEYYVDENRVIFRVSLQGGHQPNILRLSDNQTVHL